MTRGVQADHETDDSSGGGGGGGAGALALWNCGSALYDSYELAAFKRQLDATVLACSRSPSMPHLRAAAPAPAPVAAGAVQPALGRHRRRARRLPALLRRLFSKVLRLRFPARRDRYRGYDGYGGGHGHSGTGSPWSGALTSIPEESASPEMGSSPADVAGPSTLRRAQSERFIGSKTASPMVQFEVVL